MKIELSGKDSIKLDDKMIVSYGPVKVRQDDILGAYYLEYNPLETFVFVESFNAEKSEYTIVKK